MFSLPFRRALRRFALGSGPLKRGSDRLEFASRLLLTLLLLLAAPLAVAAGSSVAAGVDATVQHQAHTRLPERATLLRDAAAQPSPGSLQTATLAAWLGPDGTFHVGSVPARPGTRAGTSVGIWVDRAGRPVEAPLAAGTARAQALVAGAVTFLAVVIAGLALHLSVLGVLNRRRSRRWETGWQAVQPLWGSHFG